jgi:hypothetical protein
MITIPGSIEPNMLADVHLSQWSSLLRKHDTRTDQEKEEDYQNLLAWYNETFNNK